MTKTILAVDDSSSMRQMVSFTLKDAGYDVIEAVDGKEGLSKLESSEVHMVITDLNMPNVNGIELIKKARTIEQCKFIPIVLLTTESEDAKKKEAKTAGATGCIVKPFKPEQLISVVKKLIG
jgi:two-component system chemotaxis response regulator CheY